MQGFVLYRLRRTAEASVSLVLCSGRSILSVKVALQSFLCRALSSLFVNAPKVALVTGCDTHLRLASAQSVAWHVTRGVDGVLSCEMTPFLADEGFQHHMLASSQGQGSAWMRLYGRCAGRAC